MTNKLTNHIIKLIKSSMYVPNAGTNWVLSGYSDSGIFGMPQNKKSLKIDLILKLL